MYGKHFTEGTISPRLYPFCLWSCLCMYRVTYLCVDCQPHSARIPNTPPHSLLPAFNGTPSPCGENGTLDKPWLLFGELTHQSHFTSSLTWLLAQSSSAKFFVFIFGAESCYIGLPGPELSRYAWPQNCSNPPASASLEQDYRHAPPCSVPQPNYFLGL